MTPADLRARLEKQYPGYLKFRNSEKLVLAMAELCDDIGVYEVGGNNRGPLVEDIQRNEGFGPNTPWCGLTVEFCCDAGLIQLGPQGSKSASVYNWVVWGKETGRIVKAPGRGRICAILHPNLQGHMGVIVGKDYGTNRLQSIEGNTSSGESGSQRDGGGMYRRARPRTFWHYYINMDE